MRFGFPSDREWRQLQEAMRYREMAIRLGPLSDAQEALEEALEQHRSIEKHVQVQRNSILQDLQEAEDLRETLRANQIDLREAAQEALEQHERIQEALGEEALEAAVELAEQHFDASLDIDRMAQITQQLDAGHFARTLRFAQEIRDNAVTEVLAQQADIQAIIRQTEDAIDAYSRSEPGEFPGELTVEPPEWMRHLSRENLLALIDLLIIHIHTLYAGFVVLSAFSDRNVFGGTVSDREVDAVVLVLLVTLYWARYMLQNRNNDN